MALVDNQPASLKLEALPLYARVRTILVERLISGLWKPGQAIPSEFAIAEDLGVSQGTVRKALDAMTKEGLLLRKQGRGTFVAEAEDKSVLFRFYRLTSSEGDNDPGFPDSTYLSQLQANATQKEQDVFGISPKDNVWRFERLRSDRSGPIIWEELTVPANRFPDFNKETKLPNNVYQLYGASYGIIVAKVSEELRAVIGSDRVCKLLEMKQGSPLLEIERHAISLDGSIIERRVSLCRSDTMHYRNELK